MNMHTAYLSLGAFYSLLIAIGALALLMGGGSAVSIVQLGIGALAVVGLWGYTLGRGFMNPRIWRPLAGILAIAVVLQVVMVLTAGLSKTDITWMLISAVFSALLVVILFHYGNRDQALWASEEDVEGGKTLETLLKRQSPLSAENVNDKRKASVTVGREGNHYSVRVRREHGGEVEQFEERFSHPATLAFFIEKYTCITADDIAKQNTGVGSD
ncbi:hypothetical protein BWR19_00290 [Halomonas sp. 1513]|nr:hypothetical protein [Halomonas sp. 1513]APX91516.1 hypothetical protein BWR19_00290 [Halomonas sp. 1513]